jgi:hypothetical protein
MIVRRAEGVMLAEPEIEGGKAAACSIELSPSLPCPTPTVDNALIIAAL